jgi:transcription-repair coupling factor (superfamily II helicase)
VQSIARRLEDGGALTCTGVCASAQPFLAALLRQIFSNRPIVIVTPDLKTQENFQQDLETWLGVSPLFYPAWEILPHEGKLPHVDVISDRLQTLAALAQSQISNSKSQIVATSVVALLQKTFPSGEIQKRTRKLQRGDKTTPLDLIEWLEEQGYEPKAQVSQKGEIALRGGILDVFPPISPWPVRLEFFGDELESLREFDPLTQISREEISRVTLPPAGELGLLKRNVEKSAVMASLLDYLPRETIFILCEPEPLALRADEYAQQVPANDPFFISWQEFLATLDNSGKTRLELEQGDISFFTSLDAFRPLAERAPEPQIAEAQRREFFQQLHRWLRQDYAVHVFCNNDGERQLFIEIWKEYGFAQEKSLSIQIGALARGFICDEAKLIVVTDAEIFGRYKIQRPRRQKSSHALATRTALDIDFTDLEESDYVVHLQHGIGRYLGLKLMPVGNSRHSSAINSQPEIGTECLVIEYAPANSGEEPPKLYVPVTEAHLVSKYVGVGKVRPPLNTLGGTRWHKAKEHAERAVRDVASELLRIQAVRETQAGHAFAPDVTWQREFESAFIYEETADQVRAIAETKSDMERAKPMDRLICGDVGFGKTEVAIRAGFKAVMGGKQVAILVPTTVLAQQHFNTFRERMADYPIQVELLSRYRTQREQQNIVKNLAAGAVDIVIGTHRIVQDDIVFKDLGLVVIDEEQRFGVLHKEKFKRLRMLVDVLTLSATDSAHALSRAHRRA